MHMSAQPSLSSRPSRLLPASTFIKNRQQLSSKPTSNPNEAFVPADCEAIYDLAINLAKITLPEGEQKDVVVKDITNIKVWDLNKDIGRENNSMKSAAKNDLDQQWNAVLGLIETIDADIKQQNQQSLSSHPIVLGGKGRLRNGGGEGLTRSALRLTLAFILQALMLVGLMLIISTLNYGYSEWLCKDVRAPHTIFEALSRAFKPAPSPFMKQLCSLAAAKSNPALDAAVIISDHACIFIVYSIVSVLLSKAANLKIATSFVRFLPPNVAHVASATTAFTLASASASQYMADMLVGKNIRAVCKQPQTAQPQATQQDPNSSTPLGPSPLDILAEVCSDLWANRQIRAAQDILRGEDVPADLGRQEPEPIVERPKTTKAKSTKSSRQPVQQEEQHEEYGGAPKRIRTPKGKTTTKGKPSAPKKQPVGKATPKRKPSTPKKYEKKQPASKATSTKR